MSNQNAVQRYNKVQTGERKGANGIDLGKLWGKIKFLVSMLLIGLFGLILARTFQAVGPDESFSVSVFLSQAVKTISSITKNIPGLSWIAEAAGNFEKWNFIIFIGSMILTIITLSVLCK